ncbi:hypothetical protein [Desulfosporosinus sp. FKB]|uniref:hypothetical protein n=1 Tax=Desulfosporosinus sp. FKB TaxID=1969835 RepID=UPI000B497BAD|nr:hypothetical protein [Desulfosporosinus sp. FKB]
MQTHILTDNEYKSYLEFSQKYNIPYKRGTTGILDFFNKICDKYRMEISSVFTDPNWKVFIDTGIELFDEMRSIISKILCWELKDDNHSVMVLLDDTIKQFIKKGYFFEFEIPADQNFYRIRKSNTIVKKTGTLHIPFSKKAYAAQERFSIMNEPMLYLGNTTYICWEECNRPDFSSAYVSLYSLKVPLKVIGIEEVIPNLFPQISKANVTAYFITRCIAFFPFVAAMFMKATPAVNGKISEYIFPNMFMKALMRLRDADGIIFHSTKYNLIETSSMLCKNLALKCPEELTRDFSTYILDKFTITTPVPLNSYPIPKQFYYKCGYNGMPLSLDDRFVINYEDSLFAFAEDEMKHMCCSGEVLDKSDYY